MRSVLDWLADWQIVPMLGLAVVLGFPDRYPPVVVALALLAIPLLWLLYRRVRERFFAPTPLDLSFLILLLTLPVGMWVSARPELTLPHVIKFLLAVGLFYALVNTVAAADEHRLLVLGRMFMAGGGLLALLALAGTHWGVAKLPFLPADLADRLPRLFTAFWNPAGFHPNIVGGLLILWLPITAAYGWYARPGWRRLGLFVVFIVQVLALLLTQSRGAMLGLVAALITLLVAIDRRWLWVLPGSLAAAGLLVSFLGPEQALTWLLGSVGQDALASAEGRLELFSRGLSMLADFPLTGIGPGMFPVLLDLLYPVFILANVGEIPHVHNIYLQMGVDHGYPGLVAFLAMMALCAMIAVRARRQSRGRPWEPLTVGLLAGLVAYLVHGMVDATGYTPRAHLVVWAFLGFLVAAGRWVLVRSEEERPA